MASFAKQKPLQRQFDSLLNQLDFEKIQDQPIRDRAAVIVGKALFSLRYENDTRKGFRKSDQCNEKGFLALSDLKIGSKAEKQGKYESGEVRSRYD